MRAEVLFISGCVSEAIKPQSPMINMEQSHSGLGNSLSLLQQDLKKKKLLSKSFKATIYASHVLISFVETACWLKHVLYRKQLLNQQCWSTCARGLNISADRLQVFRAPPCCPQQTLTHKHAGDVHQDEQQLLPSVRHVSSTAPLVHKPSAFWRRTCGHDTCEWEKLRPAASSCSVYLATADCLLVSGVLTVHALCPRLHSRVAEKDSDKIQLPQKENPSTITPLFFISC